MISFNDCPLKCSLGDFREDVVVFKQDEKYYFMWSIDDARSIVNVSGTDGWYAAYHHHAVPGGGDNKRETRHRPGRSSWTHAASD